MSAPQASAPTRTCKKCGQVKPADQFYARRSDCKDCTRAAVKRRALTNPAVQEYDRARAKRPDRAAKAIKITRQWRQRHPEAYRAQNAVNNAIRDGKMTKGPCAICSATKNVHGHHKDYSKPLDVTWLCAKCHHRIHATFPELGGHHQEARP